MLHETPKDDEIGILTESENTDDSKESHKSSGKKEEIDDDGNRWEIYDTENGDDTKW